MQYENRLKSSTRDFVSILAFGSLFLPGSSQYHMLASSIFTFRPRLDEDTYITSDRSELVRCENTVWELPVRELPQAMLDPCHVVRGVLRKIG